MKNWVFDFFSLADWDFLGLTIMCDCKLRASLQCLYNVPDLVVQCPGAQAVFVYEVIQPCRPLWPVLFHLLDLWKSISCCLQ